MASPSHLLPDAGGWSVPIPRTFRGSEEDIEAGGRNHARPTLAHAPRTCKASNASVCQEETTALSIRQAHPTAHQILTHHITTLQGSRPGPQDLVLVLASPAHRPFIYCSPSYPITTHGFQTQNTHPHHNDIRVKTSFTARATGSPSPSHVSFTHDTSSWCPTNASRSYLQSATPFQPQT